MYSCSAISFSLQSTSLIRGKTSQIQHSFTYRKTSIHFPHPREDESIQFRCNFLSYFNPLPSSEGRHELWKIQRQCLHTSIHFPHPREDQRFLLPSSGTVYFNPLPSSEGRLFSTRTRIILPETSIHFPHPREDISAEFSGFHIATSIHFPHPREDVFEAQSVQAPATSIHFPHPREDDGVL